MEQSNVSLKTLNLIFAGLFVLFSAFAIILLVGLEMFFQFSFDSSAMGVIVPMLSAMQTGTIYFNRTGQRPQPAFAWKTGFCFTLTSLLISLAVFVAAYVFGLYPELDGMLNDPSFATILLVVLVVISLILWIICRFAFGMGARQAQKLKEKMQSRG